METMKAIRIHKYGGSDALVLEDVPRPGVTDDDVLVKVYAAAVNPLDWKVRAGYLEDMLPIKLPIVPGWDFSGVVVEAGSSVTGLKPGDEVYALSDITRDGSYAEYIAVKAGIVAKKPRSVDHIQAASVPLAGLTAWQALYDVGGLEGGQRVLIHAAAGGVGSFAVQFAQNRGAYVIGTASAINRDYLLKLGADEVIDYTTAPFDEAVQDIDLVLDTMSGEVQERSWKVLRKGGILVSTLGPPDAGKALEHGAKGVPVFVQPDSAQLAEIAQLIDSGSVRANVTEVLPLEEAGRAHELSETHHVRGKIVLKVV
ncbi:MAG: NADP-dependent oxidoreductase [bacterium]